MTEGLLCTEGWRGAGSCAAESGATTAEDEMEAPLQSLEPLGLVQEEPGCCLTDTTDDQRSEIKDAVRHRGEKLSTADHSGTIPRTEQLFPCAGPTPRSLLPTGSCRFKACYRPSAEADAKDSSHVPRCHDSFFAAASAPIGSISWSSLDPTVLALCPSPRAHRLNSLVLPTHFSNAGSPHRRNVRQTPLPLLLFLSSSSAILFILSWH